MTTETETKPTTDAGMGQWPPLAHIARKPVKEGGLAICGAKLMGLELDDATKVCEKCVEIARRGLV